MNFYVNQSICIHSLRINAVTNASVLQIGSSGLVRTTANLFNTGGFTGPAPEAKKLQAPLIPLEGGQQVPGLIPFTTTPPGR
ncbi:spore germination protein GerPB [Bacillus songklensis]|uniref:Spore germination protein GerPB n=1 Tax=Bacillus songklensis TaxID=1069116 RepID=A0ABV8B194_9BACI